MAGRGATVVRRAVMGLTRQSRVRAVPFGFDYTIPPAVFVAERAWVLGRAGCATDATGRLRAAVAPQAGYLSGWSHPIMQRLRGWELEEPLDAAVLLSGGHANNYYHWMFEVLPRAMLLERAGHPLGSMPVLAPVDLPFQNQSLAALGIMPERLRPLHINGAIPVGNLWCTLPTFTQHVSRIEVCRWLRERLGGTAKTGNRRLLLQRRRGKRSIINFDELAAGLVPLGFEVVAAEKLTFEKQIEWFAEAECVVAPHGAGLANLVFCQPGTRVVEILSEDYLSRLYAEISADCGLEYRAVTAEPVGRPWELREGSKQLRVDVAKVQAFVPHSSR